MYVILASSFQRHFKGNWFMKKACFITLEGIEGAGKSTLRSKLAELLREEHREVVVTREPGATSFGQAVRNLVLDPHNKELDTKAELMLFQADRAQHIVEIIRPALERGAIVLCDRYIHSTLAYQGYGRGLELNHLRSLNTFTTGGLLPDLTLLLDLDPRVGLERAKTRIRKASSSFNFQELTQGGGDNILQDRFEEQAVEFHDRVRKGFLELSKDPQFRFVVLDAAKEEDALAEEAFKAIKTIL